MPRRDTGEWLSGKEAARIISKNSGHTIDQSYVRFMAMKGKIAKRMIDGRTAEYRRSDVENIRVRAKETKKSEETIDAA